MPYIHKKANCQTCHIHDTALKSEIVKNIVKMACQESGKMAYQESGHLL